MPNVSTGTGTVLTAILECEKATWFQWTEAEHRQQQMFMQGDLFNSIIRMEKTQKGCSMIIRRSKSGNFGSCHLY